MEQVAGNDCVRGIRLGLECRPPRRHGIAFVRPQAREAEVQLHDGEPGIQLRELLEPREGLVGPLRKREPDLRLERVVPREERGGGFRVAAGVERLRLRQVPRLGVGTKAERQGERRPPWTRSRHGRRRRGCGPAVGGENGRCDDRDRGNRHSADEEHNTTPCGHGLTIAGASKL